MKALLRDRLRADRFRRNSPRTVSDQAISIRLLGWRVFLFAAFLALVQPVSVLADLKEQPLPAQLEAYGVSAQTHNEVEAATHSENPIVRALALRLLFQREGRGAAAHLQAALHDPSLQVRIWGVRLLRRLGEDTGRDVMKKDFAALAPEAADFDEERVRTAMRSDAGNTRLAEALDVALVLAEFREAAGYRLAEFLAANGVLEAQRYRAIWVLTELIRRGVAPADSGRSLEKVATDERSPLVLKQLIAAMDKVPGQTGDQVLMKAATSSNCGEALRAVAERTLRRRRIKAGLEEEQR